MIQHVVLLKPRGDLTPEERREFIAAFEEAVREIPSVRRVRVGRRVRHGAGYESQMPDSADFMAAIDFDDLSGLREYLAHPAHARLGELFGTLLSSALVFDFEATDQGLHEILGSWTS
jgi:hypothetical protein